MFWTLLPSKRGCSGLTPTRWSFVPRIYSNFRLNLGISADCCLEDSCLTIQSLLEEGMGSCVQHLPVCSPPLTCRCRRIASYLIGYPSNLWHSLAVVPSSAQSLPGETSEHWNLGSMLYQRTLRVTDRLHFACAWLSCHFLLSSFVPVFCLVLESLAVV